MGPIAATLLLYFEPEKAYAILVILHECTMYDMHNVVKPGFPGLLEAIYVMERVVSEKMPGVYAVFVSIHCSPCCTVFLNGLV